jgi:hypothetical protein
MARRERETLEHAVRTIAEQAAKADELVDEAKAAGGGDHPVTVHAKMLRLELLKVKADLERELEDFSSTARSAASTFIGSAVSASRPDIGRTGSRPRTASRPCSVAQRVHQERAAGTHSSPGRSGVSDPR